MKTKKCQNRWFPNHQLIIFFLYFRKMKTSIYEMFPKMIFVIVRLVQVSFIWRPLPTNAVCVARTVCRSAVGMYGQHYRRNAQQHAHLRHRCSRTKFVARIWLSLSTTWVKMFCVARFIIQVLNRIRGIMYNHVSQHVSRLCADVSFVTVAETVSCRRGIPGQGWYKYIYIYIHTSHNFDGRKKFLNNYIIYVYIYIYIYIYVGWSGRRFCTAAAAAVCCSMSMFKNTYIYIYIYIYVHIQRPEMR